MNSPPNQHTHHTHTQTHSAKKEQSRPAAKKAKKEKKVTIITHVAWLYLDINNSENGLARTQRRNLKTILSLKRS